MPDEVTIEVVDPGSEDDPFRQPSAAGSDPASATASEGAEDGEDEDDDEATDEDDVETQGDPDTDDDEDDELTEEELTALEELETYLQEQAARRVEQEVVPRLQSTYDRQIAAQERQLRELREANEKRVQELTAQVREAQLNGLPEAEKARLRTEWDWEDRQRQLDTREAELTGYHNEIQKAFIVQEYSQFGLQLDDLDEFETPEEMVEFAREVELEYYRLMVKNGGQVAEDTDEEDEDEEKPRSKKVSAKPKARVPAGASAPSDGGGGPAVPEGSKFNSNTGPSAMAENIKNGWDTVRISS